VLVFERLRLTTILEFRTGQPATREVAALDVDFTRASLRFTDQRLQHCAEILAALSNAAPPATQTLLLRPRWSAAATYGRRLSDVLSFSTHLSHECESAGWKLCTLTWDELRISPLEAVALSDRVNCASFGLVAALPEALRIDALKGWRDVLNWRLWGVAAAANRTDDWVDSLSGEDMRMIICEPTLSEPRG
jgi:hypothetical protein